jgi:nucleoside-diphosphate-sugar epimerase
MRSVVTGAAGFIGSTLVDRLLAEGHQVIPSRRHHPAMIDRIVRHAVITLERASYLIKRLAKEPLRSVIANHKTEST